jgi:hypothetical protein
LPKQQLERLFDRAFCTRAAPKGVALAVFGSGWSWFGQNGDEKMLNILDIVCILKKLTVPFECNF